jgi:hypothetical protein
MIAKKTVNPNFPNRFPAAIRISIPSSSLQFPSEDAVKGKKSQGQATPNKNEESLKFDDLVKSLLDRHPGESRGPVPPKAGLK